MFPDEYYYFNEGSDGNYIQIYSTDDMERHFGGFDWWKNGEVYKVTYDKNLVYWKDFNHRVIEEIKKRIGPKDIILNIAGSTQKEISDAFPNNITCEFGVGYEGTFSSYRVFESYAWMHAIYGKNGPSYVDGKFYDVVIPNYFDPDEFKFGFGGEYLLFMSRPVERKGTAIVSEIAKHFKVISAGKEKMLGIEWAGYADSEERNRLMMGAKAILCPTLYLEPFGGVVVEAQFCGTPAITTDWGAFPETVIEGMGYRCHTLKEFLQACIDVGSLNRKKIRNRAMETYTLKVIKPKYEEYFERLKTLYRDGWYSI